MGTWDISVTANDMAQDLIGEYRAAFFYNDIQTALNKIEKYIRAEIADESDEEIWCDYKYSLSDFMWKKGILTVFHDCDCKYVAVQKIKHYSSWTSRVEPNVNDYWLRECYS
jgi:hypothetical protein